MMAKVRWWLVDTNHGWGVGGIPPTLVHGMLAVVVGEPPTTGWSGAVAGAPPTTFPTGPLFHRHCLESRVRLGELPAKPKTQRLPVVDPKHQLVSHHNAVPDITFHFQA